MGALKKYLDTRNPKANQLQEYQTPIIIISGFLLAGLYLWSSKSTPPLCTVQSKPQASRKEDVIFTI
tara:strand:- start:716 stop:916 length:201 start_codon:yes stop_codon:yes gene_type:complete